MKPEQMQWLFPHSYQSQHSYNAYPAHVNQHWAPLGQVEGGVQLQPHVQ